MRQKSDKRARLSDCAGACRSHLLHDKGISPPGDFPFDVRRFGAEFFARSQKPTQKSGACPTDSGTSWVLAGATTVLFETCDAATMCPKGSANLSTSGWPLDWSRQNLQAQSNRFQWDR